MTQSIQWRWHRLAQLAPEQAYAIYAARQAVFIVEQNCPYQDMDGLDLQADHLAAWRGAELLAYLRLLPPGLAFPDASLGRIITTANARGTGMGRELVQRGLIHAYTLYPQSPVRIGAQLRLQRFYESLGFTVAGQMYMEDGIEHIHMVRPALPATTG